MNYKHLKLIKYLCYHGYLNWLPDEPYIKLLYYGTFGKRLNLKNPQNYNEKLQWLKLNAMKPEYKNLVDKYEAKKYASKIIGKDYIIPTIGVWDSIQEIDYERLPKQFVLKTTHDSGGVVICKDKNTFDRKKAEKVLCDSMNRNYYKLCREPQYKSIKPRIIAEEYVGTTTSSDLEDYKMMCFGGEFDNVMVCEGRHTKRGVRYYHFDKNWKFLPYVYYPDIDRQLFKSLCPPNFEEMIDVAEKLAKGFPHIRVDLYNVNGKIYFGELTFFQAGGFDNDFTECAKRILGKKIVLPRL